MAVVRLRSSLWCRCPGSIDISIDVVVSLIACLFAVVVIDVPDGKEWYFDVHIAVLIDEFR